MKKKTLSIIICVFNEINTIKKIINKVEKTKLPVDWNKEVIIIDNLSNDGTREYLKKISKKQNFKFFFQQTNLGKGNSLRKGIKLATGELTIFQDADLEYNPENYYNLIEKLYEKNLDAVYGSRLILKKRYHIYIINELSVIFFTKIINLFFKTNFTDTATNYKLIKTEILKNMNLISNSFAIDFEISIKLGIKGCKIFEIPIDYNPRKYEEGKKINIFDGIKSLYIILKLILINILKLR